MPCPSQSLVIVPLILNIAARGRRTTDFSTQSRYSRYPLNMELDDTQSQSGRSEEQNNTYLLTYNQLSTLFYKMATRDANQIAQHTPTQRARCGRWYRWRLLPTRWTHEYTHEERTDLPVTPTETDTPWYSDILSCEKVLNNDIFQCVLVELFSCVMSRERPPPPPRTKHFLG
jgi:hypothetical protein